MSRFTEHLTDPVLTPAQEVCAAGGGVAARLGGAVPRLVLAVAPDPRPGAAARVPGDAVRALLARPAVLTRRRQAVVDVALAARACGADRIVVRLWTCWVCHASRLWPSQQVLRQRNPASRPMNVVDTGNLSDELAGDTCT